YWNGRDIKDQHISLDKNYEYLVTVEDAQGQMDETRPEALEFITFENKLELNQYLTEHPDDEEDYKRWIYAQSQNDSLLLQNIFIDGETITIDRLSGEIHNVRINKEGVFYMDLPIIDKPEKVEPDDLLDGQVDLKVEADQPLTIILPKGDYEIQVQDKGIEGPQVDAKGQVLVASGGRGVAVSATGVSVSGEQVTGIQTYSKQVRVGENYMFFVGMGDAKAGYNFTKGNIEPVQHEDKYLNGYWGEGKMAYYLKGKIKGKYLITSSFDSERDKKELFKKIDKDTYYPVYGDDSTVDYDATNTKGNLYLAIEWDKSSVLWGNYSVGFNDTEFAQFSRSFYGGKVDYESLRSTPHGEPRTKVVAFRSQEMQRSAHNELLATGGSLYFTKHRDVTEGSDKVKIEVRDQVTGLVLSSREMKEGSDYEFDYNGGRLIFWKSIPAIVESYSIISSDLLEGNLVYVVVDYEHDVQDEFDKSSYGTRVTKALGDDVVVGGTYVKEEKDSSEYELFGTDVTVHLGKDAKVIAEYAQSKAEAEGTFVSTDGGLTFTELSTAAGAEGRAYGIKGDASLFNRLAVSSHYKWVENDFSTSATSAQQGKELIGFSATYDPTDKTRWTLRHDIQSLIEGGNQQTQLQVGATKTATTMVQFIHQAKKLKLTGEYKGQSVTERDAQFVSETNRTEDLIALRADYDLHEKVSVALEQQLDLKNEGKNKTTIGVKAKPTDNLTVTFEEVIAQGALATTVGVAVDMSERLTLTGSYSVKSGEKAKITLGGGSTLAASGALSEMAKGDATLDVEGGTDKDQVATATVGGSAKINDSTEVRATVGVSGGLEKDRTTTVTLGGSSTLDADTKLDTEIALADSGDNGSTTVSVSGTSRVDERTTTESKVSISQANDGDKKTAFTFGSKKKISDDLALESTRTLTNEGDAQSVGSSYSLIRDKNGRQMKGTLTRAYTDNSDSVSKSNIFGLSGDLNDKWAMTGKYSDAQVQNLDGTQTDRDAFSVAVGYADQNQETGKSLQSSTKVEVIYDQGDEDKRQYLLTSATKGKVNDALSVYAELEFSQTRNFTTVATDAENKEISFGGAYRPIMHDRLNMLGRYTYQEAQYPAGQVGAATDIEELRTHTIAAEGIYDVNEKWQVAEKFAYRFGEEKVVGFDFNKTHTWLMVHRLNYKLDMDWAIGGEFRILRQKEAQDAKRGFLIEASRRLGAYAQLGVGYNFTDFSDDLTDLDYTSQGPFVRLTGKFYDRTPEEALRDEQRWVDEKIKRWAWAMVRDELADLRSPILFELNQYFSLAQKAAELDQLEESRRIYRDIIKAGQLMYEEASEYIRGHIVREKRLREMKAQADQFYKNGEYEKAKKILEKILEESQKAVVEWIYSQEAHTINHN
ncbi:hypothetical protein ACFL49_03160, partial [Candidatus Omnitrophota bacterium]